MNHTLSRRRLSIGDYKWRGAYNLDKRLRERAWFTRPLEFCCCVYIRIQARVIKYLDYYTVKQFLIDDASSQGVKVCGCCISRVLIIRDTSD